MRLQVSDKELFDSLILDIDAGFGTQLPDQAQP